MHPSSSLHHPIVLHLLAALAVIGGLLSADACGEDADANPSPESATADAAPDSQPTPVPPQVITGVQPNLIVTFDASRSMKSADSPPLEPRPNAPEDRSNFFSCAEVNHLYYNPGLIYAPGVDADNKPLPVGTFNAAQPGTYYPFSCPLVNLDSEYFVLLEDDFRSTGCADTHHARDYFSQGDPAFYHVFDQSNSDTCPAKPDKDTADVCFDKITVGSSDDLAIRKQRLGDSLAAEDNTADAARTNFLNWFTFYRTRHLAAKTVLSRTMQLLNPGVRVTYQALPAGGFAPDAEACNTGQPGYPPYSCLASRFNFYSRNKPQFYEWLFHLELGGGTFLQAAHMRAGEFLSAPLAQADSLSAHRAGRQFADNSAGVRCRKNFHLMFTDGAWTDTWVDGSTFEPPPHCTSVNSGCWLANNDDGSRQQLPQNDLGVEQYEPSFVEDSPTRIFSDRAVGTMADVAFHYWFTDLNTGTSGVNDVPVRMDYIAAGTTAADPINFWDPRNDPAQWQHLVLYPIALAMSGNLRWDVDKDGNAVNIRYENYTHPYYGLPITKVGFQDQHLVDVMGGLVPAGSYFTSIGVTPDFLLAPLIPETNKFDDMLHAAINSRGQFFSTEDPAQLFEALAKVIRTVSAAAGITSNTALALSQTVLATDTQVFRVALDTETWTSEIKAYTVSQGLDLPARCKGVPAGRICESDSNPLWRTTASDPPAKDRLILTRVNNQVVAFDTGILGSVTGTQQSGLHGCIPFAPCTLDSAAAGARIAWLRGDQSQEEGQSGAVYNFRRRSSLLGDIAYSNVEYVGVPALIWPDQDYAKFRIDRKDRPPMIYVGANDGMLHGFRAGAPADGAGRELLAYIPAAVYPRLYELADRSYGGSIAKRGYVDGPLVATDARIGSGSDAAAWRTVLVGSLGAGGQGLYALDVTKPEAFKTTTAAQLALWEFSDASVGTDGRHGRELGFSLAPPVVTTIHWSSESLKWVVLASNGYASTNTLDEDQSKCGTATERGDQCTISATGNAVLYVLNLTGADVDRIDAVLDTGVGAEDDPWKAGRANALTSITAVDNDGDLTPDVAYGGDLFGNLWRFDLVKRGTAPVRLFTATWPDPTASSVPQAITGPVAVLRHPAGIGNLLYFGTGQLLGASDKSDDAVQTFYAIWDVPASTFDATGTGSAVIKRTDLLKQEFTALASAKTKTGNRDVAARVSSEHQINWSGKGGHRGWYIDLLSDAKAPEGERVIAKPLVRDGRVYFTSLIPSEACESGGTSWITGLDAYSGARLDTTPFDYNRDGALTEADWVKIAGSTGTATQVGSSIQYAGIIPAPTLLVTAPDQLTMLVADGDLNDGSGQDGSGIQSIEVLGPATYRNWFQRQ